MSDVSRRCKLAPNYFIIALLTVSCGGGDSGDKNDVIDDVTDPNPTSTTTTFVGQAVKGSVAGGTVTAYKIINGVLGESLGTAITDASGNYEFTNTSNYSGPILLEINGGSYIDEATGLPHSIPDGKGAGLKAVISNVSSGDTVTTLITPLTTIATTYAQIQPGGFTSSNIQTANTIVAQLFNITNLTGTTPIDTLQPGSATQASQDEINYALIVSGISEQAMTLKIDPLALIIALAKDYSDDVFDGKDADGPISLDDLRDLNVGAGTLDLADAIEAFSNDDTRNLSGATISPQVVDQIRTAGAPTTSELTALEQAKETVTVLRTWATQLEELGMTGETRALAIETELANAAADIAVKSVAESLIVAVFAIHQAVLLNDPSSAPFDLVNLVLSDYLDAGNTVSGVVEVVDNQFIISDGNINDTTVNITIAIPENDIGSTFNFSIVTGNITNSEAFIDIELGEVNINFEEDQDWYEYFDLLKDENAIDPPIPNSIDLSLHVTLGQDPDLNDSSVSFMGKFEISAFKTLYEDGTEYINPSHILLSGQFSNSTEHFEASFEANMTNADTFVPDGLPDGWIKDDVAEYSFSNDDNTLTIIGPTLASYIYTFNPSTENVSRTANYYWWHNFYVVLPGTYNSLQDFLSSELKNSYHLSYHIVDILNEGEYELIMLETWDLQGGTLAGELRYFEGPDEDQDNFRIIDFTLSFAAKFAGLPEANLTISAERDGFLSGNASLKIEYDNVAITIVGITAAETDSELEIESLFVGGTLTVERFDVAAITTLTLNYQSEQHFEIETLSGEITHNDVIVATISETELFDFVTVDYIDGTFETLLF